MIFIAENIQKINNTGTMDSGMDNSSYISHFESIIVCNRI